MKYVLTEGVVLRQRSVRTPFFEIHRDGEWQTYKSPTADREWYEGTPISEDQAHLINEGG